MGQKVNPHGMRVGIIKGWDTQWFADKKNFAENLKNDYDIRKYLKAKYYACAISKITIERVAQKVVINIFAAKSGMLIGKGGAGIDELKKEVEKIAKGKTVVINIREIRKPDADAQLLAESIAAQLEKRVSFRRAMKQAMGRCMRSNAKGVKVLASGRLDGAEIARCEGYNEGSIPLHTLRADIDYGVATAHTTFGAIGIKVWVYNGEILGKVNFAKEGGNV